MEAIILHRGFGNENFVELSGHVFLSYAEDQVSKKHSIFRTIWNNLRRYINKPAQRIEVELSIQESSITTKTNEHGFFSIQIPCTTKQVGWHRYEAKVASLQLKEQGEFLVCTASETAVISDIDDTLLVSHSRVSWRKLYTYLTKNTGQRKPTDSLRKMLAELPSLNDEKLVNEFFYVSNSEWNLYEFLLAFFDLNEIPKGVYALKNIIHSPLALITKQGEAHLEGHKSNSIQKLMRFYPKKQFILVGDTSQYDPQIFETLVTEQASSIKAVVLKQLKKSDQSKYQKLEHRCKAERIPFQVHHL